MDTQPEVQQESSLFANEYEKEAYYDNLKFGIRKVMRALFVIGGLFLLNDAMAVVMWQGPALPMAYYLSILVIPAIFVGLALLARKKTMLAMILGAVVWAAVMVLILVQTGLAGALSGWLMKAAMVYFVLNGFMGAKDAEEARKNIALFV